MTVVVALLRGVNVGGHNKISMETLREICLSLKLRNPQTFIQSGNVVFGTTERDLVRLARRIEDGIEKRFGFRPHVILRTSSEMREVIARNPFAKRPGLNPAKLVVSFLAETPSAEIGGKLLAIKVGPEELRIAGRELYIYFPDGMGRSKLPPVLDRNLKVPTTARNWNSVAKLLAMAESLEASE
jgi:uncharacterized protein (DUF1697 family)